MIVRITVGDWDTQKHHAEVLRHAIFILEQNVPPDMEWDEADAVCLHALAYDEKGDAVGCGRLLPDGHIGRMAVRKDVRGKGIGAALLARLVEEAKKRGDLEVVLHAQISAEAFYARYGFVREGEEFMEAGIAHVVMRQRLR